MRDGYPPVVERWEKVPLGSHWTPTLLRQTRRTAQIAGSAFTYDIVLRQFLSMQRGFF
jgi:hypothetical protein